MLQKDLEFHLEISKKSNLKSGFTEITFKYDDSKLSNQNYYKQKTVNGQQFHQYQQNKQSPLILSH